MASIILPEESIIKFYIEMGRGPSSKDYELVISVLLKRYLERKWKTECSIAFNIKENYRRNLSDSGYFNIQEVEDILKHKIEEDHPIDVYIYDKKTLSKGKEGRLFQLKRFGKDLKKRDTQSLIDYLKCEIPRKYAKINATLFLVFEWNSEGINFKKVIEELSTLNSKKYPFEEIMFTVFSNEKMYICRLWPEEGQDVYRVEDLLKLVK